MTATRGNWGSRLGFILAAAGSAVGLGNIWKFPYVVGENGGGLFVLIYLLCVGLVGLPIMVAEVLLGRATQSSPVMAFRAFSRRGSPWVGTGWLGVAAGFIILSFYSVVAGWTLHYVLLSLQGAFSGTEAEVIGKHFDDLAGSSGLNLFYHGLFMALTIAVVFSGVQKGIERCASVMMPALFIMLIGLGIYSSTLPGFGEAMNFVFAPHLDKLRPGSVLEAMGQAFFSLSLGMGAMLTYGSYLPRETGIVKTSIWVASLDTLIALLSGAVVFPIIFSSGMKAGAGPGLVFKSIPIAFSHMPGGSFLCVVFFVLLVLAALTSSISLLEVVTSSFIDLYGWGRRQVSLATGFITFAFGVPSALSGGGGVFGAGLHTWTGRTFFDWVDYISSNWMLPTGGLLIALFVGRRLQADLRRSEFVRGTPWPGYYALWIALIRYLVPLAVVFVFLRSTGILSMMGIES